MATVQDAVAYLLINYPHKGELSNARVTKMVYLADWHQAITRAKQITPIAWYFDNYGPFVWDIKRTMESNPDLFKLEKTHNYYGTPKTLLGLEPCVYEPKLTHDEQASLDHVIEATKRLGWDAFIKVVYGTYPVASSERYTTLDLIAKAREYRTATAGT